MGAKELSIAGEEVVFCISDNYGLKNYLTKLLLQLQLEAEFEDFYSQNQQSKKIKVKSLTYFDPYLENLEKTHVFMDEVLENRLYRYANLQAKSLWVAVSFDYTSKTFKDATEAINT